MDRHDEFAQPAKLPKAVQDLSPERQQQWRTRLDQAFEYAKKAKKTNPLAWAKTIAAGLLKKLTASKDSSPEPPWLPGWAAGDAPHIAFAEGDREIEAEIFRAGSYGWKGSYTREDIAAIAADYVPAYHEAPVTLNHDSTGKAYGWVKSLRARGDVLLARFTAAEELVEWLRAGEYRKRSVELYPEFVATGRPHLKAVTFLGTGVPEVKGMEDIKLSEAAVAMADDFVSIGFQASDEAVLEQQPASTTGLEEPPEGVAGLGAVKSDGAVVYATVDGNKYPAHAFAHVGDPDDPATWSMRVWDGPGGAVTAQRVDRLATMLSPGGYNGRRATFDAETLPRVRARLRAEYRRLGVSYEGMSRWVKEAEPPGRFRERYDIPLEEASREDVEHRRWPVTIITAGPNRAGTRHYSETLLRDDGPSFFEGAKMSADHPSEVEIERGGPSGSTRNWVAVLKDVFWDDGRRTLRGYAHVTRDWFQELLQGLSEAGSLDRMRVSILATGQGHLGADKRMWYVEGFGRCRSVDFVTTDGAGGHVELQESMIGEDYDVDIIDLAGLEGRRPDLLDQFREREQKNYVQEARIMEQTVEEMKEAIAALETERDEHKSTREAAEAQITEMQERIDEHERGEARAAVAKRVDDAVAAADPALPPLAVRRICAAFRDLTEATDDEIAAAVTEWQDDLRDFEPAVGGRPRDMGESTDDGDQEARGRERAVAAFKRQFIEQGHTDEEAQRMAENAAA
jgi:hypothetical protein